jgi:hypothetical protein
MDNNEKLAMWHSARGTRNPAIEALRDNFDGGDPWGSTMEALFQLCYTLARGGAEIPASWEFSPGAWVPSEDDNDPDNEDGDGSLLGWEFDLLLREGHYRNLIHAGEILNRYAAQLKLAGLDY